MKNSANVQGDKNTIIQGVKKSNINVNDGAKLKTKKNYALLGVIVAILTLIASVIIGWDNIINFFNYE